LKQGFNRATQLHVAATSALQVRGPLVALELQGCGEDRYFMISGTVHLSLGGLKSFLQGMEVI
jgi:hypothetical protein